MDYFGLLRINFASKMMVQMRSKERKNMIMKGENFSREYIVFRKRKKKELRKPCGD